MTRCILRVLDDVSAWAYRRRYEARVRRQMRAGLAPLFVVLVLATGCVPGGGSGAIVAAGFAGALACLAGVYAVTSVVEPTSLRERRGLRIFALLLLVGAVWLVAGCAPIQARRTIRRIESRCTAAYEAATTRDEVVEIHDRCEAAYEEVRRGD